MIARLFDAVFSLIDWLCEGIAHAAVALLGALGGQAEEGADHLTVHGVPALRGGTVDGCGDHRIVMAAAIAATACAPPTLYTCSTPHRRAAYNTSAATLPSLLVGVHNTTSSHPAIFAGKASINTVENNGAVPPGMYKPTLLIATGR